MGKELSSQIAETLATVGSALTDLASALDTQEPTSSPPVENWKSPSVENWKSEPEDAPKPAKRKRRTKAQIEADKKAEIEARIAAAAPEPEPESEAQEEAKPEAQEEAKPEAQEEAKPEPKHVVGTEEQRVADFKTLALPNLSYAGELLKLRGAKRFTEMTARQQEDVLWALRDQDARRG